MDEITIEQLVDSYNHAKAIMDETEAAIAVLKDSILDRLREMRLTGITTKNGYRVQKVTKTTFSETTVTQARAFDATVTQEKVDTGKLRDLYNQGVKVPGVKQIVYVDIRDATKGVQNG